MSIHPGKILKDEFLTPLKLSQNELAKGLHVPTHRIWEIVSGRRSITADTALRLGIYFGNTYQFWLNLQMNYDIRTAKKKIGKELTKIHPLSN